MKYEEIRDNYIYKLPNILIYIIHKTDNYIVTLLYEENHYVATPVIYPSTYDFSDWELELDTSYYKLMLDNMITRTKTEHANTLYLKTN